MWSYLAQVLKIKQNTLKKFLIFPQKKNVSYISGKWNSYTLGNRTFKPS